MTPAPSDANTPSKKQFSQHANTLAVLADVITGPAARDLMARTLSEKGLAEPGLFFKFYVHLALAKIGDGGTYLDRLSDWHGMPARGLSTFAETVERPVVALRRSRLERQRVFEIFRTVLASIPPLADSGVNSIAVPA